MKEELKIVEETKINKKSHSSHSISRNSGITLVALIITIIVLLILAVVAIRAVTGNGIIAHAKNAQIGYEEAQAEEKDTLTYYEKYLATQGNVGPWKEEEITNSDGTTMLAITMIDSDGNKKIIPIGAKVDYSPIGGLSTKEISDLTYTSYAIQNASKDKNEGRTSGYNADQTFKVIDYTGDTATWQVLGVENGNILLISSNSIVDSYYLGGKEGYKNSVKELNSISSIYGCGKGAGGARSVNVEDINNLTKYNPETTIRNQGQINEYGNKVEYSFDSNGNVKYSAANSLNGTSSYTRFIYWDNAINDYIELNRDEKVELISNNNGYDDRVAENKVEEGSVVDNLLFSTIQSENINDRTYWLASRGIGTYEGYISMRVQAVNNGRVRVLELYLSDDSEVISSIEIGVRPVVILKSNVILYENELGIWEIKV